MNNYGTSNKIAVSRAQLAKLELQVAALPEVPQKKILLDEIKLAKTYLDQNDTTYSESLTAKMRFAVWKLKWSYRIWPNEYTPPILIWFKGVIIYSVIVLGFFGPASVIVDNWDKINGKGVFGFKPVLFLFNTVIDTFNIPPRAFYWGSWVAPVRWLAWSNALKRLPQKLLRLGSYSCRVFLIPSLEAYQR